MLPVFLFGALAGAGALYAASEISARKNEQENGGKFDASALDIAGLSSKLNSYFFKASALDMKCSELSMRSTNASMPALRLEDDSFLQKIGNAFYDATCPMMRKLYLSQLCDINDECHKNLSRYAEVFKKANEVLEQAGQPPVFIAQKHIDSNALLVNNALSNDDWDTDFDAQLETVRSFISATSEAADKLANALDALSATSTEQTDTPQDAICA